MAKPKIEVSVKEKMLFANGRSLRLEDNFEGAGVFIVGNKEDETILELNYRKNQGFLPSDAGKKVYNFLEMNRDDKIKKIEVYSYRPEDSNREVFPAVSIIGEFTARVYN